LKTGKTVVMPSLYDEMSPRAYANYPGGTEEQRRHRALLRTAMEAQGFTVYPQEWWHFDYKDWRQYPIMNVRFEDIHAAVPNAGLRHRTAEPSRPGLGRLSGICPLSRRKIRRLQSVEQTINISADGECGPLSSSSGKNLHLMRNSVRYSGFGLHSVSLGEIFCFPQ